MEGKSNISGCLKIKMINFIEVLHVNKWIIRIMARKWYCSHSTENSKHQSKFVFGLVEKKQMVKDVK